MSIKQNYTNDTDLKGYIHTKPDKFENATFAAKTDKMFSVHINRFQTVLLSTLKRCLSPRMLTRQSRSQSHMAVVTLTFSKSSIFAVHTNTLSRCFQIYPLCRAFSISSVFRHRKHCFSVDGRPGKKSCVFKFIRLSVDVALSIFFQVSFPEACHVFYIVFNILGSVNLCKIFQQIFEVWENVQT